MHDKRHTGPTRREPSNPARQGPVSVDDDRLPITQQSREHPHRGPVVAPRKLRNEFWDNGDVETERSRVVNESAAAGDERNVVPPAVETDCATQRHATGSSHESSDDDNHTNPWITDGTQW
jgi:hypothetical protein